MRTGPTCVDIYTNLASTAPGFVRYYVCTNRAATMLVMLHAVLFVNPACGVRRQIKFTGQIPAAGEAQGNADVVVND
jgi:hypothetical protein